MISLIRIMTRLDAMDPRLSPLPDVETCPVPHLDILNRRKDSVEMILSITDDDPDNPIRFKGSQIVQIIVDYISCLLSTPKATKQHT